MALNKNSAISEKRNSKPKQAKSKKANDEQKKADKINAFGFAFSSNPILS